MIKPAGMGMFHYSGIFTDPVVREGSASWGSCGETGADSVSIGDSSPHRGKRPEMTGETGNRWNYFPGISAPPGGVQAPRCQESGHSSSNPEIVMEPVTKKTETCCIDLEYPRIEGTLNGKAGQEINRWLESLVKGQAASFEQGARLATCPVGGGSSLEGRFTTAACNDRFVSFIEQTSSYVASPVHSFHRIRTFNFDAATGNELTFFDLFRMHDDSADPSSLFLDQKQARQDRETRVLRVISAYCVSDLIRQNGTYPRDRKIPDSAISTIAGPYTGNFDAFALTDKGLLIYFQDSHTRGLSEVTIPYWVLTDLIDPGSVLGDHASPGGAGPGREGSVLRDEKAASEVFISDDMIIIDDVRLNINRGAAV